MKPQVEMVKEHCTQLISETRCSVMPYHNLEHTMNVYNSVQVIGEFEGLNLLEIEILKIAALFHDTGFAETYFGHEEISIRNARQFLKAKKYPEEIIEKVVDCIRATKMPQRPISKLEKIICDSDLFHLSSPDYILKSSLLQQELNLYLELNITDDQWLEMNLSFLRQHKFCSPYGKTVLADLKNRNIQKLENLNRHYSNSD